MFYLILGFLLGEILTYFVFKLKYGYKENIRDYKEGIEKSIMEAKNKGYKIYFRTPECDIFLEATLSIALEDNLENGREEVIMINLD